MSQVPAATRALRVLRFLASQPDPVPLDRIMRACDLPRSTAYHLLSTMVDEGFVIHLAEEQRYGLGVAAFEVGSGYSRQEPLQRIARRLLAGLVDATGHSAHLAVLHGRDVLYVVEERAPGRPPLVTDVGVRLPAHLTASGRAILAALPAGAGASPLPRPERRSSTATARGPTTLSALRTLLAETRQRGYAVEDGEVTPGFASVAAPVARPQRAPGRRRRRHLPDPDGRGAADDGGPPRGRGAHCPAGRPAGAAATQLMSDGVLLLVEGVQVVGDTDGERERAGRRWAFRRWCCPASAAPGRAEAPPSTTAKV